MSYRRPQPPAATLSATRFGAEPRLPGLLPLEEGTAELRAELEASQQELERQRQELDRQLQENERLAEENRRLAIHLSDAERMREAVLGSLSHELRTPLTAILGWAQLLRGGKASATSTQRALESIERNAKAQARLIDDLLDASRLAAGNLSLQREPVLLAAAVDRAVEALHPLATARRVTLSWEPEPFGLFVAGDQGRLEQLVRHLVENAVKFSPVGGLVEVRAVSRERWAELTVTDEGPGIPDAFRPFLFERFRQADPSATRAHGGLGLGLSIVRQLVELHGGTVVAEVPPSGHGTRFVVRLPLAGTEPLTPPHLGDAGPDGGFEAPSLEGITVLLVDDDAESLEVIAGLLGASGARVLQARSSREALLLLGLEQPDVLLADLRMPEEDGFGLLRAVRAREPAGRPPLPAIALTAASSAADRTRAVAGGFHFHVPKPVDRTELAVVVRRLVPTAR